MANLMDDTLENMQADSEERSERIQLIRLEILRILRETGQYLLAEPILRTHLMANLGGIVVSHEFTECLQWLRNERLICQVQPKLGLTKYMITDQGRALIEQNA
jgi:hypothetical protein